MGRQDVRDILFPVGGIARRRGFQQQPPYTCPDALNVRPEDVLEERLRGGSRPGLAKAFNTQMIPAAGGSAAPARLLNSLLTGQPPDPATAFSDDFGVEGLESEWESWTPSGVFEFPATPVDLQAVSGKAVLLEVNEHATLINTTTTYETTDKVEIRTSLWRNSGLFGADHHYNWAVAAGLNGTSDWDGGIVLRIRPNASGTNKLYSVQLWNQGALVWGITDVFVDGSNSAQCEVRLVVQPDNSGGTGKNAVELYLGDPEQLVTIYNATLAGTDTGLQAWHSDGGPSQRFGFEYFDMQYTVAAETPIAEPALIASANGNIWFESASNTLSEEPEDDISLASDRLLSSAERFGKLYIADYELGRKATDGTVNGMAFDDAAGANWDTIMGSDPAGANGWAIEILTAGDTNAATLGVYLIASHTSTAITLASNAGGGENNDNTTYRLVRRPKVFDYREDNNSRLIALAPTTAAVNPPLGCTIAAIWQDRLVLTGDRENPGDLFMSEQGDPNEWQESTADTSAVYLETQRNGVRINKPVTAAIPFTLDYLVVGSLEGIHVLRGNPVRGGTVDTISNTVGIVDKHAWCTTPEGLLIVMTGDGLYVIDQMATSATPASNEILPREFTNIDIINNDVQIEFDVIKNGVFIAVTPKSSTGVGKFWWFDWTTRSYWQEQYLSDHHPTAMTVYVPHDKTTPRLVFGCRDGYIREHLRSANDDDGFNFPSHVLIGPIALGGGGYHDGMLREVVGMLAESSATVTCEVQVGDSIEEAYNATPRDPFTLRAGKSLSWHPRLRGNACFLRLSSLGGSPWALEQLSIVREKLGKERLLA